MHICKFFALCLLAFTLSACGDQPISPGKVILVSALDEAKTVSLYFGNDQENYIDVGVKSGLIQQGKELRSEDSSLSDGLDASASWGNVNYFSSSKHPTFTYFKIVSINMAEKKAVVEVAAKLVNPDSGKYIEFTQKTFEITGNFFDEFTRFIGKEILTTTAEQRDMIEKSWGGVLFAHQKKIEDMFNRCKPDNYQDFAIYKVQDWLPKISQNTTKMNNFWEKLGHPITPEYENIGKIIIAMIDLNTTSITMQSYLKNNKKEDLEFVNKKISKISEISSQYVEYQPKSNQ